MTGIISTEKSPVGQPSKMIKMARGKRSCLKPVTLAAVVSAVVTACLATTVFMAIYWTSGMQNNASDDGKEWTSWTVVKDGNVLHVSVLLDVESRTVLVVSAESNKIGGDNSMALHDFDKGLVAIRDFRTNACYVSNTTFPDFKTAKTTIEKTKGKRVPIRGLTHALTRPTTMTPEDLGPKLTNFCYGAESHWFDVRQNDGQLKRSASKTSTILIVTEDWIIGRSTLLVVEDQIIF